MSRKPYIVQQDSPNLAIVPTDTVISYEESSEKVKLVRGLPAPSQNHKDTAFAKKYGKSNFNGVNNNVLIDVSQVQKPPTSWATNYLESIGGSSTKFTKIYPAMPKSPSLRKNIQPENNTKTNLANITQTPHQTKTNTETRSIMEEKQPKINIYLKHKPNSVLQSTLTKETNQTNSNTKSYQSKMDTSTNQVKVHKVPSLPKNYKIPMQSKNKPVIDKETRPNISKDSCQNSQPLSSTKSNDTIYELKQSKLTIRETTSDKSVQSKADKDTNRPKHELVKAIQPEVKREKAHENQFKAKKIKFSPNNENYATKPKYDEQISPPQASKETVEPIKKKENSQPKYNKEIKQSKANNETTQPKKIKTCPPKSSKEIMCLKTNENIAPLMSAKETYKINNNQEPTFSSKLKTKKDHVKVKSSKTSKKSKRSESKDSQGSKPKKHKDKTLKAKEESNLPEVHLEKENIVTKPNKKQTTEKESVETAEYTASKSKKLITGDVTTTKKENSKAANEERLSKSISPIKSVVSKIKSDGPSRDSDKRYHKESGYYQSHFEKTACTEFDYNCHNSQKSLHVDSDVDLRAKLKRKHPKNDHRKEETKRDPSKKINKFATAAKGNPFVPEENLITSFNTKDDDDENATKKKSPEKKLTRKISSGGNKCKKIKLEINIVFRKADTTDDESVKSNEETKDETLENMDLSFLDDFNVDEIVESLNECKDCSNKVNNMEPLSVPDITIENSLSSETQKTETMLVREHNALLNKNETEVESEVFKEISSMENKIENQESAIHSTVNQHSSYHHEELQSRIDCDISKIKEEVENKTKMELPQKEKSQETNVCMPSSEMPKVNSSLKNTVGVHQKTDIPNIVFRKADTTDDESVKSNEETKDETLENMDLSFLDDINVDEIVESLNECKDCSNKVNNMKPLSVPDITIENSLSSETQKTETMLVREHNALLNKNETEVESEVFKEISSMENKIENQESAIHSTVNQHSSYHHEELQSRIDCDISKIKEEVENKTKMELPQKEKSQETNVCMPSSEMPKVNSSLKNTVGVHQKTDIPNIVFRKADTTDDESVKSNEETKDETLENMDLSFLDDFNVDEIVESLNECKDCSNKVNNMEPLSVPDITIENSVSSETQKTETMLVREHNALLNKNETEVESEVFKEISSMENKIENQESAIHSTVNQHSSYHHEELQSRIDCDISKIKEEVENKTKMELPQNEKSQETNVCMPSSEMPEVNSSLKNTVSVHQKTDIPNIIKSNHDQVTNSPNSSSPKPSSGKPTDPDTVVPEKCTSKSPNKSIPQENDENKDKVTRNNEKVERNLVYDHFIEIAETKLFFFMGRKCTVTDVIRIGKYSKIYLCKDSLKHEFALKALKKESDRFRSILKKHYRKEKMLMRLQNGVPENNLNCVRLIKGFVICRRWCILMEFYPKNLQQAFLQNKKSFHIDDVQILSRQLVSAVTILRNNNIIHSDIKPSHILINTAQTRIKLCGFDQSSYIGESTLLPNTGTVNYRAPELILGYPAGYGIDVWSTALVMYEMATNRKMFPGIDNNNILYQQLCTIGNIPMDMLMESKFRNKHFRGTAFTRIVGSSGERIIIDEITFIGKIDSILFKTYAAEWGHGRSQASRRNDKAKLSAFLELLQSMLVMHPRHRIAVEFVFANPFINDFFYYDY